MNFRELEKTIKADGWRLKNARGSHYHYSHPSKPGKVSLPCHKGDINIRTVISVLRQAGIKN
jgi:predicted RNA binding protein YcfA (HicA-like mRNA interferase family)